MFHVLIVIVEFTV